MVAMIGGQVTAGFCQHDRRHAACKELASVKVLGRDESATHSAFPDLPTISEAGVPGFESPIGTATACPGGTPTQIVNRLIGSHAGACQY